MKKLSIILCLFISTAAFSQSNTEPKKDTAHKVFILQGSKEDYDLLSAILQKSQLVDPSGKPLTFEQVYSLLKWVSSAVGVDVPKKETPKK